MKLSTLSTWNPGRELDELAHRFSKLMGQLPLGLSRGENGTGESLSPVDWVPPVDITEDSKNYSIKMDMPEVLRENVRVTVKNGALEITGERKAAKEEKNETRHRVERISGTFSRIFTLPDDVKSADIKAECRDGVLKVTLPKSAQAGSRQLDVPIQ